jgi:osmotically-inducible protein OsmY
MTATTTRTDEEILRDVQEELKWDARLQPNEIGVIVDDSVVTLTGWVDSYVKRWAAERATQRVAGVHAVANEIEVRLPNSSERTDPDIAGTAIRALQWDSFVPADAIMVTVSKGWVRLEGEVQWQFQKDAAERAVRSLAGVKGVSNLILVRPGSQPSSKELSMRIREALIRDAETDAERISVDVQGDKVMLKGVVRSWAERREAERAAWSAPGVREVEDHIVVGS